MATTGNNPGDDDLPEYTTAEMNLPEPKDKVIDGLMPLELEMFEDWRNDLARWLFHTGKNVEFSEGYPPSSMEGIFYRIDKFCTWVWDNYAFTTEFDVEMADEYWNAALKPNDNALSTNRKTANAVALIFKRDGIRWKIPNSKEVYERISKQDGTNFTDWFSVRELKLIREASLKVYAVPRRDDLTVEEEDEWAAHLAQRLEKPKEELTGEDWGRANSYKIPSLVYASTDVGFRPCEIERAPVRWFRLDEGYLQVPKGEDSKDGKDHWRCYFSDETVTLLRRWLDERKDIEKYDGREEMWLTRRGNPYSSSSLRRPIMQNLMDAAGIDRSGRETGWYLIRRGVGTDVASKAGIEEVMSQLRISNVETAERYVRHDERAVREWLKDR